MSLLDLEDKIFEEALRAQKYHAIENTPKSESKMVLCANTVTRGNANNLFKLVVVSRSRLFGIFGRALLKRYTMYCV